MAEIPSAVAAAVRGLAARIESFDSLDDIPSAEIAPLQTEAARARIVIDDAILAGDAAITAALTPDPVRLVADGFAATILATQAALATQAELTGLRGLIGRAAANIARLG